MSQDTAILISQEKQARQHLDRMMAAVKAHDDSAPAAVQAELDEAKRQWEAARKRLEAFTAERSR